MQYHFIQSYVQSVQCQLKNSYLYENGHTYIMSDITDYNLICASSKILIKISRLPFFYQMFGILDVGGGGYPAQSCRVKGTIQMFKQVMIDLEAQNGKRTLDYYK